MSRPVFSSDVKGAARLAVDATLALTDVVEAMHGAIVRLPFLMPPAAPRGLTGHVYRQVRRVTGWVGSALDIVTTKLQPVLDAATTPAERAGRDAVVAILNGVLGDHLADTGNPLATAMTLRSDGAPVERCPGGRVLVLLHGLCMHDQHWLWNGHDHGRMLADAHGYAPVYLRYNTGRHISTNGRELAALLERWTRDSDEPLTELALLGYSMGGLVARSACHYGMQKRHRWVRRLRRMVFLGTPHHGAPLERGGNWIDATLGMTPYSAPLAALARLRSAGITDLRYGSVLDEDWVGRDRFQRDEELPRMVPLPDGVDCAAIAATAGGRIDGLRARLLGDGLVPVASALGRHDDPERTLAFAGDRQWLGNGMHHFDLLSQREVQAAVLRMFEPRVATRRRAQYTT